MNLKLYFTLFLFGLFCLQSFAQDDFDRLFEEAIKLEEASKNDEAIRILDVLDSLCHVGKNHSKCFEIQYKKGFALMSLSDYNGALAAFRKGLTYSRERKDPTSIARYLDAEASFLQMTGKLEESMPLYWELISIKEYDGQNVAYRTIGNDLLRQGKKDSAKVYLDTALMLAYDFNHPDTAFQQSAISLSLIALAKWENVFGSKRKAIELHIQSLEYTLGQQSYMRRSTTYIAISELFTELKDFEKAEKYVTKAIKIAREQGYNRNLVDGLLQLGSVYNFQISNEEQILNLYKEIYGIVFNPDSPSKSDLYKYRSTVELGKAYLKADSLDQAKKYIDIGGNYIFENSLKPKSNYQKALGAYYAKTGDYQQAIKHFEKALEIIASANIPNNHYIYNDLANAYYKNGNAKMAFEQLQIFNTKKDSIYKANQADLVFDLEAKYESELKDKKIIEEQLNATQKTKQRNMLFFITTLLALLALGVFYIYRNKLNFQKRLAIQEAELANQKIGDLEQKNKLLALSSVIEGQEEERLRVAKDLHDGIGGLLTTVKNHFTAIQKEIDQIQSLNLYQKTGSLIDEACVEVRRISHNMVPHSLSLSGLEGTLEDMVSHLNTSGINCTLETQGDLSQLSESQSVMIYRIIQELTNNVSKHANTKNLLIQILPVDSNWNILIEDDGEGFDLKNVKNTSKSLGLKSVESRVKYLNGTIIFDSVPGTGTTVNIEIPTNH